MLDGLTERAEPTSGLLPEWVLPTVVIFIRAGRASRNRAWRGMTCRVAAICLRPVSAYSTHTPSFVGADACVAVYRRGHHIRSPGPGRSP